MPEQIQNLPQTPPQQDIARVIFAILILFYLTTSPNQGPPPGFQSPGSYAAERYNRARYALDVLNLTKWEDFSPKAVDAPGYERSGYLNLTGFREEDNYAWEMLETFKKRSIILSKEAKGSRRLKAGDEAGLEGEVYENITGIVAGRWVKFAGDINGPQRQRTLNLSEISPQIDWAYQNEELWTRNITGKEGRLMLRLEKKEEPNPKDNKLAEPPSGIITYPWSGGSIKEVAATMTIQDESSTGDGWEMRIHGVHWPRQGAMLLTTTSEKFAGIFGLPHLTTNKDYYATSQGLLNRTLEEVVEKMEKTRWADSSNPWTSSPNSQTDATMPTPHCEYIVYVQVQPSHLGVLGPYNSHVLSGDGILQEIEEELRFPNGAPIQEIPRLQISTIIFSPDCGFMLGSKGPPEFSPTDGEHLVGKKQEEYLNDVRTWILVLAAVAFAQIHLLKAQLKDSSTPSTIGRVSLYTISMMLLADGIMILSMSLLNLAFAEIFPTALLAVFTGVISCGLGIRFIGAVYSVQEPERQSAAQASNSLIRATRVPGARVPVIPSITAAGADILPPPVTTSTSSVSIGAPIIVPSDQDIDAEVAAGASAAVAASRPSSLPATTPQLPPSRPQNDFSTVAAQLTLSLLALFLLTMSSISWAIPWRTAYTNTLSFVYLSFWIPQIQRNITRNCRKALLWKFVIGQSILRLSPFAYFYLKKDNILFSETDWKAFCILAGWLWIQIWILVAQEVLGPKWGVPKKWVEEGWDYHPVLREDNVEAGGLPIGLMQIPSSPTLDRGRVSDELGRAKKRDGAIRSVDCAICMQDVEVPVIMAGEESTRSATAGGVAGMLARRQYMVTPCRHVFHSKCLEGWMRFRLQCPICREALPPL
ncbi:hypothetical protein B7494_g1448 [Chlorociboria aeruginascens]|nr:hypothetical protein B7494_g1448 [Chlorociboria aeruginascens]